MASDVEEELRRALASGDFGRADKLIPRYRDHLHRELIAAKSLGNRLLIIEDSRQLLQDSLHLARVMRAHIASKLRATESIDVYQHRPNSGSRWSVIG
jgi:hypothetical protein